MLFRYRAIAKNGKTLRGEIDAPDRDAVVAHLHAEGLLPVQTAPARSSSRIYKRFTVPNRNSVKLSSKEITRITRQLATMLKTGIPLGDALTILQQGHQSALAKDLIASIQRSVSGGSELSTVLANRLDYFDQFYIAMIKAGEISGRLDQAFARLADYREETYRIRASIIAALTYPALLAIVSLLSLFFVAVFVMPKFSELFADSGAALPFLTLAILTICDAVSAYWIGIVAGTIGIILLLRKYFRDPTNRNSLDKALLRIPMLSELIAATQFARFTRSLANLITSGIPLVDGMRISHQTVTNRVMGTDINNVIERVRNGEPLASALESIRYLPDFVKPVVASGEASGKLDSALLTLSDSIDEETKVLLDRVISIAEPSLIVGIGVIVAVLITSVLSAVLSLNEIAV